MLPAARALNELKQGLILMARAVMTDPDRMATRSTPDPRQSLG
jgi:hypothetical protein